MDHPDEPDSDDQLKSQRLTLRTVGRRNALVFFADRITLIVGGKRVFVLAQGTIEG